MLPSTWYKADSVSSDQWKQWFHPQTHNVKLLKCLSLVHYSSCVHGSTVNGTFPPAPCIVWPHFLRPPGVWALCVMALAGGPPVTRVMDMAGCSATLDGPRPPRAHSLCTQSGTCTWLERSRKRGHFWGAILYLLLVIWPLKTTPHVSSIVWPFVKPRSVLFRAACNLETLFFPHILRLHSGACPSVPVKAGVCWTIVTALLTSGLT